MSMLNATITERFKKTKCLKVRNENLSLLKLGGGNVKEKLPKSPIIYSKSRHKPELLTTPKKDKISSKQIETLSQSGRKRSSRKKTTRNNNASTLPIKRKSPKSLNFSSPKRLHLSSSGSSSQNTDVMWRASPNSTNEDAVSAKALFTSFSRKGEVMISKNLTTMWQPEETLLGDKLVNDNKISAPGIDAHDVTSELSQLDKTFKNDFRKPQAKSGTFHFAVPLDSIDKETSQPDNHEKLLPQKSELFITETRNDQCTQSIPSGYNDISDEELIQLSQILEEQLAKKSGNSSTTVTETVHVVNDVAASSDKTTKDVPVTLSSASNQSKSYTKIRSATSTENETCLPIQKLLAVNQYATPKKINPVPISNRPVVRSLIMAEIKPRAETPDKPTALSTHTTPNLALCTDGKIQRKKKEALAKPMAKLALNQRAPTNWPNYGAKTTYTTSNIQPRASASGNKFGPLEKSTGIAAITRRSTDTKPLDGKSLRTSAEKMAFTTINKKAFKIFEDKSQEIDSLTKIKEKNKNITSTQGTKFCTQDKVKIDCSGSANDNSDDDMLLLEGLEAFERNPERTTLPGQNITQAELKMCTDEEIKKKKAEAQAKRRMSMGVAEGTPQPDQNTAKPNQRLCTDEEIKKKKAEAQAKRRMSMGVAEGTPQPDQNTAKPNQRLCTPEEIAKKKADALAKRRMKMGIEIMMLK